MADTRSGYKVGSRNIKESSGSHVAGGGGPPAW